MPNTVAYLAPEIPALSATFVYEEMLALERRGFKTLSFSVRRPMQPARDQADLAKRTSYLYEKSKFSTLLNGLIGILQTGQRRALALQWLRSDMAEIGWLRVSSWKLAYQFLAATQLAKQLLQQNCSHLHIHFAHTPAQIGMYAAALSGIPFTITAHANDIFERGLLLQKKAARAVRFLTISEHNRQFLLNLGIPESHLAVVRCGVSLEVSKPQKRSMARNTFRIGSLGRMVEKKGFDVMLRAVAKLKRAGYAIDILLAGDGPLRKDLEQLAVELEIKDITKFEGNLPHNQVASWMRNLDAFVLACKKDRQGDMDGIPVVLMEAMSQSVPVISTRISGIPELVVDGLTGLLALPGDETSLFDQIRTLIEAPSFSEKLTEQASQFVVKEFGQNTNIDRLIQAFDLHENKASRLKVDQKSNISQ